jgi:hypothetical protein
MWLEPFRLLNYLTWWIKITTWYNNSGKPFIELKMFLLQNAVRTFAHSKYSWALMNVPAEKQYKLTKQMKHLSFFLK